MRLAIGSDHRGFYLKGKLISYLLHKGYKIKDLGTFSKRRCDYPPIAFKVAKLVAEKKVHRGILICGTGIGNSIVANKVPGVRAALCYNIKMTKLSREHNNSNILVLAADFISVDFAKRLTGVWLNTSFLGGRHRKRLFQIKDIETKSILKC